MPATDYGNYDFSAPFAVVVTPSDTTDLNFVSRAIYVGGTGNITVVMAGDGSTVIFSSVPAGTTLPVRVSRVKATGTTVTNIVAMW